MSKSDGSLDPPVIPTCIQTEYLPDLGRHQAQFGTIAGVKLGGFKRRMTSCKVAATTNTPASILAPFPSKNFKPEIE